jgi:hypothetical protein
MLKEVLGKVPLKLPAKLPNNCFLRRFLPEGKIKSANRNLPAAKKRFYSVKLLRTGAYWALLLPVSFGVYPADKTIFRNGQA